MRRLWLILGCLGLLAMGGVAVAAAMGGKGLAPARTALQFPWGTLAEEAETMNDCVECHEPDKFHTCATCHDDHGSAEMSGVPFNTLVLLAGDLPEPGYIAVNDILPYRDQRQRQAADNRWPTDLHRKAPAGANPLGHHRANRCYAQERDRWRDPERKNCFPDRGRGVNRHCWRSRV